MSAVVNALLVAAFLGSAMATQLAFRDKRMNPICPKYSNLFLGKRELGDSLVYSGDVKEPSELLSYTTGEFHFPEAGYKKKGTITRIEAIDNELDGTGGCPRVVKGGIGAEAVHIRITSWWSKEINYHIHIYGLMW